MIWEPVSKILGETNQVLKKLLTDENKIQDMEVLLRLSVVLSKNEVLEEMAKHLGHVECDPIPQPIKPPRPAFMAEIEDDNPDKEDADIKKAREEERGFFG